MRGAFQRLWADQGLRPDDAVASVYAGLALPLGWVELDRALPPRDYDELTRTSASWAGQDRSLAEVLATFGPPSIWFGGTNPYYPETLGYTTGDAGDPHPLVCFHLWNCLLPAGAARRAVHDEPILLAVRHPGDDFQSSFTFTPAGQSHRQAAAGY